MVSLLVERRREQVGRSGHQYWYTLLSSKVWVSNSGMDRGVEIKKRNIIGPANPLYYLACSGNASFFIKIFEKRVNSCTWKDFIQNYEKCILSENKKDCIEERKFVENVLQILKEN